MTEFPPDYCPSCGAELDGTEAPRYRCPACERSVYHTPTVAASVTVVDTTGEAGPRVLLGERGVPPGNGRFAAPGGHVDLWEAPEAAAARELAEETGLSADPAALTLLGVRNLDSVVDEPGLTDEKQVISVDYAVPYTQTSGEPAAADDLDGLHWRTPDTFEAVEWAYTGESTVCLTAISAADGSSLSG